MRPTLLLVLASVLAANFAIAGETASGPMPFPDAKDEKAWPGTGPIRAHPWMKDNRAAFWSQREKAQGSVVFAGDSLTGGWKLESMQSSFPKLKIANRGIGGDVSRGLHFRFQEDVLDLKPRALVLLIGTNDLSSHAAPAGIVANIAAMIEMARKRDPKLPIVLCTIPPRDAANAPTKPGALADLNKGITEFATGKENLELLDLHPLFVNADGSLRAECFAKDKIHLVADGYTLWANALKPIFAKLKVE